MRVGSENLDWLDLLRVAAALAVVFLHVAAEPVVFVRDLDSTLWHVGNLIDSLTRWCVGIFIMVSGALLLNPVQPETVGEFFRKRVRRLLVPLIFWSTLYLGLAASRGQPVAFGDIARLLWEGHPWYHMWYLFMIVGLYAVTPLLRLHVARSNSSLRWIVIVLSLLSASAWDLVLSIDGENLPGTIPTMFIPYLGYFLLGYELRRLAPIRIHPLFLWSAFAAGSVITIVGTYFMIKSHGITRIGLYMYEYLSPNVILMTSATFCLASQLGPLRGSEIRNCVGHWVSRVVPLTLGIYICHPIFILGLREIGFNAVESGGILGVPLIAIPAFCASLALTWAISVVPVLRRTVGLR